ncbi:hypothetical protein H4Q26_005523 [Puccinia striiformis f. sp. tritici PST-130]|nr:hypothetical protein H4Q26_005523 [Puccinia striiformis f. sp. tritici PST-130]
MGFANTLVNLILDEEDKIYLEKNKAYLKSKTQDYAREINQEIIQLKKFYEVVGVDQTLFSKDVNTFLDIVTSQIDTCIRILEKRFGIELLDMRGLTADHI